MQAIPDAVKFVAVAAVLRILTLGQLSAQVVASGQKLTVTTSNAIATFQGPDLAGLTNRATGESYLKLPPSSPLMNLELLASTGEALSASAWTTSTDPATGATVASLTMQDSVRTVTIRVTIDSASQEIVVQFSGQSKRAGVSTACWGIAGLDVTAGHLIVPAQDGSVYDAKHLPLGSYLLYPGTWQAQMAVYETSAGSAVLYSTDPQYLFKRLSFASRDNTTLDLCVVTEAPGPWASASSVPTVEWRMKAFAGDWRTAAAVYRDWLAANRPPVPDSSHAWVRNIRTVVDLGLFWGNLDPSMLDTLAAELNAAQTLIYIPGWRQSGYDVNYPDYTPQDGVAAFIAKAHSLGFKVMLHTNLVGASPGNPDFASVQQWQAKDPGTLQPRGWNWSDPASPTRHAFINPASSTWRKLFISRVGAGVAALQPDALHLDTSEWMFNDGNGLIEGLSYAQGSVQLHKDVMAAFPNLALGGEGTNDIIYGCNSFAQAEQDLSTVVVGHPIDNFLWNGKGNAQIQYYSGVGESAATDPGFKYFVALVERQGILPAPQVADATYLDLTNADNARFFNWLKSWQSNGFQPDWTGSWNGALLSYKGAGGSSATLSDTGTVITLKAGGSTIYQRVHDTNQQATSGYVLNWPAFDSTQIYGLDAGKQYWLDPVARPSTTHVSSLPAGVQVGPETMVSPGFAYFQLAPTPAYDFLGNFWAAKPGITYNGVDGPVEFGAQAHIGSATAGGVTRQGIFMPPPYEQGHAGGETFVEWQVPVPASAWFSFSVGVDDSAGTCTDGVTFRVAVNGAEAWRQNVLHQGWVDGYVDLSSFAGTTARLRIVTNPGPANNPSCDWALFSNLALTSLAAVTASVPLVLAPGATPSGFSGSGTFSAGGASAGTVTGMSVPGQFVLFTAPGSPVSSGTSLTTLPYIASLGGEGELAVPGSLLGSGQNRSATSGGVTRQSAICALPADNNGRTVLSWTLALPSANASMLNWSSALSDDSVFTTGVEFEVRINGTTYWTLLQTAPAGWIPGSLDLSAWRGQNVLVQLVTNSVGSNGYDGAYWADLTLTQSGATCSYSLPAGTAIGVGANSGTVTVSADSGCPWTATTDVPWILLTATSAGSGTGTVAYTVFPNATGAGRTGRITAGGQAFAITQLGSTLPPLLNAGGAIDGASFHSPLAPGSIAAVFGTNMAVGLNLAVGIPLPTALGGLSMKFNGSVAVPFFFASPNQANIQIPWELIGQTSATLMATTPAGSSSSVTVPLAAFAPAIFSLNQQGTGQGIVTIASTTTFVAPVGSVPGADARPASKGEYLSIYCIGLGDVSNRPLTGAAAVDASSTTRSLVTVSFGSVTVPAAWAGLVPGLVGLFQVNVQVPATAPSGAAVPLVLTVGGANSNSVTIALQ